MDVGEPDYDYLGTNEKWAPVKNDNLKKSGGLVPPVEDYILGTLVIRVVAARDLGGGNSRSILLARSQDSSINPYASVKFMGKTQRTLAVFDARDPIWPRSETMYMDVALPLNKLSHRAIIEIDDGVKINVEEKEGVESQIMKPVVTVSIFNASQKVMREFSTDKKKFTITANDHGDSNDPFLGTASLDITPLLTGKKMASDRWLPLDGGEGTVRIVCEYEASDSPPKVGDIVSFARFCSEADLYPVPITLLYKVKELDHDDIVLEYTTPEGWICTFIAHRSMVICEERHQAMLVTYQQELFSMRERLTFSPLLKEVKSSVNRVPDDGIIEVGLGALEGAGSIFGRWCQGGIDTIKGDLQFATNWDGRFNESVPLDVSDTAMDLASPAAELPHSTCDDLDDYDERDALPGMPDCPITGQPMKDPVVAADGHTYERIAIARWLETSDKSPLTGAIIDKKLVSNYMLISSLQDAATESSRAQASITEEIEDKKMPAIE